MSGLWQSGYRVYLVHSVSFYVLYLLILVVAAQTEKLRSGRLRRAAREPKQEIYLDN
jgi:hypothetical protein